MSTDKQIAANRANALLSTGPTTPEGRAISSHNAVKNGLTGQTVLLKTDDVEVYNAHVQHYVNKYNPANHDERLLVQDLADTEWRLLRIPSLEAGIYAVGRIKLAPLYAHETDEAQRALLIEADVCMTYRKDLSNLSLQHTRLYRHRMNVLAELKNIQQERKNAHDRKIKRAALYFCACRNTPGWPFNPEDLGFEFSLDEMFLKAASLYAEKDGDEFPEVTNPTRAAELKAEFTAELAQRKAAKN